MPESINEKLYKIKFLKNDILLFLIFTLALAASFAMGYLSYKEKAVTKIYKVDLQNTPDYKLDFVIASKQGNKYYFLWCANKNIKKENVIFFKDTKEAERAGYSLSKTCR